MVKEHGGSTEAGKDTAREWLDTNSAGSGPYHPGELDAGRMQLMHEEEPQLLGFEPAMWTRVIIKEIRPAWTPRSSALENGEIDIALSV